MTPRGHPHLGTCLTWGTPLPEDPPHLGATLTWGPASPGGHPHLGAHHTWEATSSGGPAHHHLAKVSAVTSRRFQRIWAADSDPLMGEVKSLHCS